MDKRFLVHIYFADGVVEGSFRDKDTAIQYAETVFNHNDVYKVKVWDLRISDPVPNVETHRALILHLA